jgi:8-oxo-dGTP pyrophosphatase MutT (NUDIX family)
MQQTVSIVLLQGANAYISERLNRADNFGKHGFPGGKVEYGETEVFSAQRELFQETGVVAKRLIPLGKLQLYNPDFGHYESHGFGLRIPPRVKVKTKEPDKHSDWKAVPVVELLRMKPESLLPGTKEFVKAATKKFRIALPDVLKNPA